MSRGNWGGSDTIIYTCVRCGATMSEHNILERGDQAKCINCGFRVLKKTKPPVVKRVKAE